MNARAHTLPETNIHWSKNLLSNLRLQLEHIQVCIELAKDQRDALIHNRLNENRETNKKQEKEASHLERLEKTRLSLVKKIQNDLIGREAPEFMMEQMLQYAPEQSRGELRLVQMDLKQNIEKLRQLNLINATLINNARKINQTTVTLLTGMADSDISKQREMYGSRGQRNKYVQQKRSLYNKKV